MKYKMLMALIFTAGITACSNMSNTQQRTLSGGAIGAAAGTAGALIFNGNPIWGAVGGAAVGATAGYVYDQSQKQKQPQTNSTSKPVKTPPSGGTSPAN